MALKSTEVRVGLVVVAALAVFLFSLFWMRDFRISRHRYELVIVFPTVGGLSLGDPVHVAGVKKGQVQDVHLQTSAVRVTISLDSDVQLPADSRFSIQNMSLMGEKFMAVEPGSLSVLLQPGQVLSGQYRGGMSEVMGEVGELLHLVQDLAHTLHQTIGNPEAQASIRESLENIRRFSQVLADLMDEQGEELSVALKDLRSASQGFRELVQDNRTRVDSTLDQFQRASLDLEQLTQQLSEVSATFKRIADRIERGEGSLGEFVADETLYQDIKRTVKNLDELIVEIKENPQKYLRLEIF
jgi:phospholipid/cholesterol/gamma-HCH transport system substrate-binding protein